MLNPRNNLAHKNYGTVREMDNYVKITCFFCNFQTPNVQMLLELSLQN